MGLILYKTNTTRLKRTGLILVEGVVLAVLSFGLAWLFVPIYQGFESRFFEDKRAVASLCIVVVLTASFMYRFLSNTVFGRSRRERDEAATRWIEEGRVAVENRKEIKALLANLPPHHFKKPFPLADDGTEQSEMVVIRELIAMASHLREDNQILVETFDKVKAFLVSTPHLTGLLQAHLAETNTTTETAIVTIMRRLTDVKLEADKLLETLTLGKTKMRAASLYSDAQDKIGESRKLMEEMDAYQRQRDKQINEYGTAIQSVLKQVEELKPFTDLIRELNTQTNMLAINAAIEATRAGKAGRGFAVISGGIRELSKQVESASVRIKESIEQVTTGVNEKLSTITTKLRSEDEEKWLSTIALALPRLSGNFQSIVEELNGFAENTNDAVHVIHNSIIDALGYTQFQDITRQQVEQVQKGISLLSQHLCCMASRLSDGQDATFAITTLDEIADSLRTNYTMLSQHETHLAAKGEIAAGDGRDRPAIELF